MNDYDFTQDECDEACAHRDMAMAECTRLYEFIECVERDLDNLSDLVYEAIDERDNALAECTRLADERDEARAWARYYMRQFNKLYHSVTDWAIGEIRIIINEYIGDDVRK